jgi:Arc/MetJ-type ribon-helix-helix transcriptional regulator
MISAARWPWVSRRAFDERGERIAALALEKNVVEARLTKELARSEHLMHTLIDMKVSGGSVGRAALAGAGAPRLTQPTRSAVDQAIDENKYASSSPALRRFQQRWAKKQLDNGTMTEAEILDRLRSWSAVGDSDDDDDDDDDDEVIAV